MRVSGRAVAVATQVARDTPPSACQHFQYLDQPTAFKHGIWCLYVLICIELTGQDGQLTRHSGLRDPRVRSPAASRGDTLEACSEKNPYLSILRTRIAPEAVYPSYMR